MSVIEAMVRAAWQAREDGFPERIRIKFEQRFAEDDALTTIMVRAALAEARKHGWQLVPVNANGEMDYAARTNTDAWRTPDVIPNQTDWRPKELYRAMLSAAPSVEDA